MFLAKRTEDQIWSIETQIKPVCGRTTIVSLNRRNLGTKPCEEGRNTQDNDNEHTSIQGRAHLPKVTTDHRRDINIFTTCWKNRTPDKNQTPHFYKQWRTCETIVFRAGFCSDLKGESHDAYNKTLGNPQHVFCYKESTGLASANDATQLLLNCNVQTPSHQTFVRKTIAVA